MTALQYVLAIVIILVSIALIALVMLQESKQQGLSGTLGGSGETFFGKNKSRTKEAKLAMLTKVFAVIFHIILYIRPLIGKSNKIK